MNLGRSLRSIAGSTVGLLPVRIRAGAAKGARWTVFPWTSYWKGTHEPAVQAAIVALGDIRGLSCWDLGAHFGFYSVMLAQRTGPEGQVAAFEPNPKSFRRLELHGRMNALGWLKAFACAASDTAGASELITYGDLGSTTTHLAFEGETMGSECMPIGIRTVRLDDEVDAGRVRAPDFIKVDVEGHAHHALRGMARTVARTRPRLIVAFHSEVEVSGVLAVLEPLGYSYGPIGESSLQESLVGGDFWFRS